MQHLPPSGWDNVATKEDLRAGFAETNAAIATGLAQAATDRAEIVRKQAWHLYIVVSAMVLASVSIWIALLTQPGGG